MEALYYLVNTVINLYIWAIIIMIILGWLMHFGVINAHNQFVQSVYYTLQRVTEPALGPIRRLLPDMGGIDISPIILIIGLEVLRRILLFNVLPLLA